MSNASYISVVFAAHDFRVIELSGKDVGILAMSRQPDCVKLYQMFILPVYQGKGIGEACMKLIVKDADVLKLPIRLQVLKVNPRALAFYHRLGFKQIGESDDQHFNGKTILINLFSLYLHQHKYHGYAIRRYNGS